MSKAFTTAVILSLQLLLSACGVQSIRESSGGGAAPSTASSTTARSEDPTPRPSPHRPTVSAETRAAFERANRAIRIEDWPMALAELHALVENRPDLSGPCLNLALVYQHQKEPEPAEQYYRRALQANPYNLTAHNQFAIFLREQGRFRDAEQTYLQALTVWEAHPDTHRNIGVLYDMYMGDRLRALQHFNRYQDLTGADDLVVAGWIADLQRQLLSLAQGEQVK